MKTLLLVVVAVLLQLAFAGCSRARSDPQAALVGRYRLYEGHSNCSGHGIESSTLELRADGSSQQTDQFKDGSRFVTPGKWEYDGGTGISIDNLRTTATLEIDKNATPAHASLIVQWSKPPNILLNPHGGCLFAKVQ
jgi:hypothetical protein